MVNELKEALSPEEIILLVETMGTLRNDLQQLAEALHQAANEMEEDV